MCSSPTPAPPPSRVLHECVALTELHVLMILAQTLLLPETETVVIPHQLDAFITHTIVPHAQAHWFRDTRTCCRYVLQTLTDGDKAMRHKRPDAFADRAHIGHLGLALAHRVLRILTDDGAQSALLGEDDSRDLFTPSAHTPLMNMRCVAALLLWLYFFTDY